MAASDNGVPVLAPVGDESDVRKRIDGKRWTENGRATV